VNKIVNNANLSACTETNKHFGSYKLRGNNYLKNPQTVESFLYDARRLFFLVRPSPPPGKKESRKNTNEQLEQSPFTLWLVVDSLFHRPEILITSLIYIVIDWRLEIFKLIFIHRNMIVGFVLWGFFNALSLIFNIFQK